MTLPNAPTVAPLTGSVDRNNENEKHEKHHQIVAPLTGSVDRNKGGMKKYCKENESLPSRGAWIEIFMASLIMVQRNVAPLTGSVDRNGSIRTVELNGEVAPLTGSVDRNSFSGPARSRPSGRSPHGERG